MEEEGRRKRIDGRMEGDERWKEKGGVKESTW
jgi:hypothetical protein